MAAKKMTCRVCGKEYDGCATCQHVHSYSAWRNLVDSIDHYKIFCIVRDYANKDLTKEQAKARLSKLDTTGYETWETLSGEYLRDLLKEESKPMQDKKVSIRKSKQNVKKFK